MKHTYFPYQGLQVGVKEGEEGRGEEGWRKNEKERGKEHVYVIISTLH